MRKFLFFLTALTFFTLAAAEFTGVSPQLPAGTLQIIQIDTGDVVGDAYIIRTPQNKIFLLDTGDFNTADQYLIPALEKHQIRRIDTVILTHLHSDHVAGLFDLLNDPNFEIGEVLYTAMPENEIPGQYTQMLYRRLMDLIQRNNIPVKLLTIGDTIDFGGGITAFVCGTASMVKDNNLNSHSLVFRLVYGEFSALFTGDCSFLQERAILDRYPEMLACDLLKAGHHAGANATSPQWLDAIAPKAIISCMPQWLSLDNRGKRVEAMITERRIPFFRSWEYPDLIVFSDGKTFGMYPGSAE